MVKQMLIQNHNRYVATERETQKKKNELPFKQNWFFEVENNRIASLRHQPPEEGFTSVGATDRETLIRFYG